jgi:hypothetical protein
MAKKKKDEMTVKREIALKSGKVVVTQEDINPKLRMQLLKNYGLFIQRNAD